MVVASFSIAERTGLLREAFDELRANADEFEARTLDELGSIDRLRQEILVRLETVSDDRRTLDQERERLHRDIEKIAEERSQFQSQIASLHEQSQRLSASVLELSESRAELLERLRSTENVAAGHDSEMAEKLHARDEERQALETELETVRRRAAELADALQREKREASDERAGWIGEVRELRQSLADQGGLLVELRDALKNGVVAADYSHSENGDSRQESGDAVLDSVMSQFQELQRDISQRRRSPGKIKP